MTDEQTQGGGENRPQGIDTSQSGKQLYKRLIPADSLPAFERERLMKEFGWDGISPVPSDLAKRVPEVDPRKAASQQQREAELQRIVSEAESELPPEFKEKWSQLEDVEPEFPEMTYDDQAEREALQKLANARNEPAPSPTPLPPMKSAQQPTPQQPTPQQPTPQQPTPQQPTPQAQRPVNKLQSAINQATEEFNDPYRDLDPAVAAAAKELDSGAVNSADPRDLVAAREAERLRAKTAGNEPEADKNESASPKTEKSPQKLFEENRDRLLRQTPLEEQENYQQCLLSFIPYYVERQLLGGKLIVRMRELGYHMQDMIMRQSAIDDDKLRRPKTDFLGRAKQTEMYELCARIGSLTVNGKDLVDIPVDQTVASYIQSLDFSQTRLLEVDETDLPIRFYTAYMLEYVLKGPLLDTLSQMNVEVRSHMEKMAVISTHPDFLKAQS